MALAKFEVAAEKLRWECDPKIFKFECTKDLAPLREFIGQERAIRAVEFGLNMANSGYNIYVAGLTGTGKTSMVKSYIEKIIREKESRGEKAELEDWCYLYNFKEPDSPKIVNLARGQGKVFRDEVSDLLTKIRQGLGQAFSSEEYKTQRQKALEDAQGQQQKLFEEIAGDARRQGYYLQMTPAGPILVPMKGDRPMQEEEYMQLKESERKLLDQKRDELLKKMQSSFERAGSVQMKTMEQLQKADKDIGEYTVSRLFNSLQERYGKQPKIQQYLEDLKTFVLDNLELFKGTEEPVNPFFGVPMSQVMGGRNPFVPFQVNIFVDNSEAKGPPVIAESNPNFGNIFGKIDRRFLFGGYLSDHTMLKAGALSQANGGYLLLSATDVLTNPGVWPALKRAIKNKEVKIEEPFEQFGMMAPQGLRPEPMPIYVKVILIGDGQLYQVLTEYDEDFWEIFKVKADFNWEIEKTKENMMDYAAFLSGCCEDCKTRHFDPTGVAKVIENSARSVADQEKLSTRFAQIKDWIEEADYWASRDKAEFISAKHVQKAIDERRFRHNLLDERMREMITDGTIMIDAGGAVVGQVNGLSVYSLGDISFGKPSRITAKTFLGRGGVINIERESQLSGPIHDKGVMILSGYLGWKYAQDKPLSLSASLCFEQSYEGVEGDSASSTELYAILSSLSDIPIKQGIAVTGSVNQKGEIQPIGGVNQKIEGFFQICQSKGLTGDQGVLIPEKNLRHLMLREEVVAAVKEGKFHIYSASTIDEGIEVLTGVPAGGRDKTGAYPKDSINYLVDKNLKDMAERLKSFTSEEKDKEKRNGHKVVQKSHTNNKPGHTIRLNEERRARKAKDRRR
ncbi:MAG TPA: AAA family ATPase [Dehalococcoidales bacterium]|nr:AAA family ATPase [Dehalococcoidales bacterium]